MKEDQMAESDSRASKNKAHLVSIHVQNLVMSGLSPTDINVTPPYKFQEELIKSRVIVNYQSLDINYVDGFQGREKEVNVFDAIL
ncbi:hypothetical protein NPIL_187401 [Nephila pilipes]|uniref:DNA2/NAM7 helicase-like C-terminal domain-containing protein n=1 Tax=Nephila pilipes TaxID=299642 RepID=A0A8X6TEI9_NEPPI|nr:hypothetical protein NPIL_187401 [Nephila pilipes]